MEYKLSFGASKLLLPQLDAVQQSVLEQIKNAVLSGVAAEGFLIYGRPGAGRTSVALSLAGELFTAGVKDVLVLVPDRLRADYLQATVESLLPGIVRPVKTPVALAYKYLQTWYVERAEPRLFPQLLTGAREDIELAQLLETCAVEWPENIPADLRALPAFRMELRNLFERAREAGLDGAGLVALGESEREEIWVSAGKLLQLWETLPLSVGSAETPALLTTAQLQETAAQVISAWSVEAEKQQVSAALEVPRVVIVDDLQDCTVATLNLLVALAKQGTVIVATANPDIAVATYRGGEPHLDGRFREALQVSTLQLGPTYRGNQVLSKVVDKLTGFLPVAGGADRRKFGSVNADESASAGVAQLYASAYQEVTGIIRQLNYQHLHEKVEYQDMAVIVRRSHEVEHFRQALVRNGIPTSVNSRAITYLHKPITAMLLLLLSAENVAVKVLTDEFGQQLEVQQELLILEQLVRSPLVKIDPLKLRRVTDLVGQLSERELNLWELFTKVQELDRATDKTSDEAERAIRKTLKTTENQATVQVMLQCLSLIHLGRELQEASPNVGVWKLWQATGLEDSFVKLALAGTSESVSADDRLDAVISLCRTADVWQQRHPEGTALDFANELVAQTIPSDNLATIAQRPAGIEVLTVMQAAGRQWPVVFVAGVQSDVWPNLAIRNRLTKASQISLKVHHPELKGLPQTQIFKQLKLQSRVDELRTFVAAVSRSSEKLFISAVSGEDTAQSVFFDLAAEEFLSAESVSDNFDVLQQIVELRELPVAEMRPLVAKLRRLSAQDTQLLEAEINPELARVAEQILASLALQGVRIADPLNWTGTRLEEISHAPVFPGDKPVLSPSAIESLLNCPAQWFLSRHGGSRKSTGAAGLGTLIHTIAEKYPHGDAEQMLADLEIFWDDGEYNRETELGRRAYTDAREKIVKLAQCFADFGNGEVEVEKRISVDVGIATIMGVIDRLEHIDGAVRVTDIKTGYVPSVKETQKHKQLAFYQYALMKAGYEVMGARLLGLREKDPAKYIQSSIMGDTEISKELLANTEADLQLAVERVRGPFYQPIAGSHCDRCAVQAMCPLKDEGLRTIE
ncbi:hypothetical protein HMPREF0044_0771 [Gleimia coleocanis DSM 15436]|uniref:UvrD-like helicase C-terminal domain-containing protein n=1 Tax=Gleimia coleocanis DSM 15436 TaxID=525245 RepID=C0W128_9ACTO|nr:UrvD/REP family ATP-dependent DNA helicase [Gleimia coleocanis]EEH63752.1 hypothetical protein HMPREF0044_0771 [Gleimia coleocanis DSM 15436]